MDLRYLKIAAVEFTCATLRARRLITPSFLYFGSTFLICTIKLLSDKRKPVQLPLPWSFSFIIITDKYCFISLPTVPNVVDLYSMLKWCPFQDL